MSATRPNRREMIEIIKQRIASEPKQIETADESEFEPDYEPDHSEEIASSKKGRGYYRRLYS
jgi:hypothetical protein